MASDTISVGLDYFGARYRAPGMRAQAWGGSEENKKYDVEKARHWQAIIRDAARSGMSTLAFRRLRELP